ncbi:MAG: hypothetical protein AB4290_09980 [Spirulina sp.]
MSSQQNRPPRLEITVNASHSQLLEGLDYWVQLGLIGDAQVKQLSRRYLTCALPEPIIVFEKPKKSEFTARDFAEEIPVPVPIGKPVATPKRDPSQPSGIEKIFQAFKDELSLRWLFFLGIFLIIVSSGVMAASQWQYISSVGQYGILYLYTLIFGLFGWWTGTNEKLKLTSQTLKTVALLLIPINFVAMDSFGLWGSFLGVLAMTIATLSLSAFPWVLVRRAMAMETALFLGLCYLHWGWNISDFPLLAINLGAIPTAILLRRKFSRSAKLDLAPIFFLLFALTVLFVRGLILEQLPLGQLGLTIGIGGWLCTEIVPFLESNTVLTKNLEIIGIILILLGWQVGLTETIPWQSLIVSGLGFWCFLKRLQRYWHWGDLLVLFAIAAQGLVLCGRLIPRESWQNLMAILVDVTGYDEMVALLVMSAAFAYSFVFIDSMGKLYRLEKPNLAYFGEGLALILGGTACLLVFVIPSLRSLSLGFWTISCLMVAHRVKVRPLPIYLAHIAGAIAIFSLFPWLFPNLAIEIYGLLLLIWAIGEWFVFTKLEQIRIAKGEKLTTEHLSIWSLSCWYLGFIGAVGSYLCASISQVQTLSQVVPLSLEQSGVLLTVPLLLTLISRIGHPRDREFIWTELSEGMALILGGTTCLLAYSSPSLLSLSLLFWTISFLIIAHRVKVRPLYTYLAHLSGSSAILSLFPWLFPTLTPENYGTIFLIWAIAEWIAFMGLEKRQFSKTQNVASSRLSLWSLSCWHLGFIGAVASYLCWIYPEFNPLFAERSLGWLLVPLTLTVISRVSPPRSREAAYASTIALVAVQGLLVGQPFPRITGLAAATGLMVANAAILQGLAIAFLGIGYGLGLGVAVFWQRLEVVEWLVAGAIATALLWGFYRLLQSRDEILAKIYREAADLWATILAVTLFSLLTFAIAAGYEQLFLPHWAVFIAPIVVTGAIAFRGGSQPRDEMLWGIAWGLELIVSGGLLLMGASTLTLATVNIIIGVCLAWDFFFESRSLFSSFNSLRLLPLVYGLLGVLLRFPYFNEYTGFLTLGAALTGLAISMRRPSWRGLSYLSLAGFSVALYELTIYQMLQGSGGSPVDGLIILAIPTLAIAFIYRIFTAVLHRCEREYLSTLRRVDLVFAGNIHWAIASLFMVQGLILGFDFPSQLRILGTIIWGILPLYAVWQGRGLDVLKRNDWWVIIGLLEAGLLGIYFRLFWPEFMVLSAATVFAACTIALALYSLPWQRLGWRKRPWQYCAIALPFIMFLSEFPDISTLNLLLVAGFYLRVAQQSKNWRWTYFALGLCNWAIARFFQNNQFQDPLWYVSLASLSIIYIAQFDPALQDASQQKNRHLLRVLGSSLSCVFALVLHSDTGLVPSAIGLLAVFIGLGVKVRAFLYVGTITFLLATFYQLIILIFQYAFLKWVIGLIAGIVLIIVAANFERSRDRVSSTFQNWLAILETWE